MTAVELRPLDTLLTESVRKPDFFFVLGGQLTVKVRREEDRILGEYDIFGYTKPLDNKAWLSAKVIAKEHCLLVKLNRSVLKRQVEKLKKIEENASLIAFLVKTVPGVKQLGQASKERVLNFFEHCNFKAGDVLLRERVKANWAFIIYKGECKLICSEDPLKRPGSAPARGLMSLTTSCYNFGLVTEGEWVGEDSVLFDNPMEFSVQATTAVKALRIPKEKFLDSLNKDTQNALRHNLEAKLQWIHERKAKISSTIFRTVYNQDASIAQATFEHTGKQYPKASRAALLNIRRNELARVEYNSKLILASPNARQSPVRSPSPDAGEVYQLGLTQRGYLSRPLSHYSSRPQLLISRPQSSSSHFTTQPRPRSFAMPKPVSSSKVKLHSACTLGYSLVPTIPQAKMRVASARVLKAPPPKAEARQPLCPKPAATFAQQVRNGRAASPNPVEVWANKYKIPLYRTEVREEAVVEDL